MWKILKGLLMWNFEFETKNYSIVLFHNVQMKLCFLGCTGNDSCAPPSLPVVVLVKKIEMKDGGRNTQNQGRKGHWTDGQVFLV